MGILAGLIMGFVYAVSPGPVNVETLRRGVNDGFLGSLAIQAGTAVGRILYALLALFGAGVLLQGATLQLALGAFGVAVLFYLGLMAILDGQIRKGRSKSTLVGRASGRSAFWVGAVLSLANPLAAVFWLSIGSRVMHDPGFDGPAFLAGFFGGCIAASLGVAVFASLLSGRLSVRVARTVSWASGLVFIGFGLKLGQALLSSLI